MLLQGASVRVVCVRFGAGVLVPLWSSCKKGSLHLRNLGAATGCCCQSAVCGMKPLGAGVAAGGGCECEMSIAVP